MREAAAVEAVVEWAYAVEKVDRAPPGMPPQASQTQRVVEALMLGGVIRTTGPGGMRVVDTADADALAVHRAVVTLLEPGVAELVMRHARRRTWPDWRPVAALSLEPVWCRKGTGRRRPSVRIDRSSGGAFCPVRAVDDDDAVAAARAEYAAWRRAMLTLYSALRGTLRRVEVAAPASAPEPWRFPTGQNGACQKVQNA